MFLLLFHQVWTTLDFRNSQQWLLPNPNTAPMVFVFPTNSGSKVASWAFEEEQPRQPFKTISSSYAALIPVALISTTLEHGTTDATCDAQMLSLSLEKSLLLLSRWQSSACCRDLGCPSHPIPAWPPHAMCSTSSLMFLLFCIKTTFIAELILWWFRQGYKYYSAWIIV